MSWDNSLRYDLRSTLLPGSRNNNTFRARVRAVDDFVTWTKSVSGAPKHLKDVTEAVIQAYTDDLMTDPRNYTPATIHAKIAPICLAAGVPMERIRKPKRTADKIVRGRQSDFNTQGQRELHEPRFARLVAFQSVVGIRREELRHLRGSDWNGTYVTIRRGKGGRMQKQFVLPEDRETVNRIFAGVKADKPVFSVVELNNKINLHALRAEHARKCYAYYTRLSPRARKKLRASLLKAWDAGHPGEKDNSPRRALFIQALHDDTPYRLRGANRGKAAAQGLPEEYDRLSLYAVSVRHLAHWRINVTVTNYML